jgi:Zn-finger nucleic acid-binding protein
MPYLCPQCEGVFPTWGALKGHLIHSHKLQEYKESAREQLEDYAITEEEAKERKRKKVLGELLPSPRSPPTPWRGWRPSSS